MKNRKISLFAGGLAFAFSVLSCGNSSEPVPPAEAAVPLNAEQTDGQKLFVQNCAACHQKDRDAMGPALRGVRARWNNEDTRLYKYIRNNVAVTQAGDARAVELQKKWGAAMPLFDGFSDKQIKAILDWVEE